MTKFIIVSLFLTNLFSLNYARNNALHMGLDKDDFYIKSDQLS